jgi:hypothetical protein
LIGGRKRKVVHYQRGWCFGNGNRNPILRIAASKFSLCRVSCVMCHMSMWIVLLIDLTLQGLVRSFGVCLDPGNDLKGVPTFAASDSGLSDF